MNDSMAHSRNVLSSLEMPEWKTALSWIAGVLICIVFLVAGLWKITDAPGAAVRLAQAKVPGSLSLPAALILGIIETFAGVLILVPRFRRWGAWLASALLVVFMIYIGVHYGELRGEECSCFPWVKRAVGPGFFIADGAMLLLAALAGWWARPAGSRLSAALILAAVSVFALVSYGVAAARPAGRKAPESITANGAPFSLQQGRVFIYFFDPECSHCTAAAKRMAALNWKDTKVVGVATVQPQFAEEFMQSTGLKGVVSRDLAVLKGAFPFGDTPAAVALENGRQKAELTRFDEEEPAATLRKIGFVQ